ncbi:MAG: hypothetical protein FJ117_18655 [Deltaproteobacteria bacterium]|nr:hypothetical protein [Deltaproteobacteria bacterium]
MQPIPPFRGSGLANGTPVVNDGFGGHQEAEEGPIARKLGRLPMLLRFFCRKLLQGPRVLTL